MKNKGIASFFTSFFVSFFSLLFFSLLIAIAFEGKSGIAFFVSARLFSLPLPFYLVGFSVGAGLLYSIRKTYDENKTLSQVEEYLRYLSKGVYSEQVFQPISRNLSVVPIEEQEVFTLILDIRKRMMRLSLEAQGQFKKETGASYTQTEEIVEGERRRIARELHDSVSQQLFAAMMMMSAINEQSGDIPSKYQKQLQLIQDILNESQSEMRALLLHLRPVKLEGKTLKEGIELLLGELKTKTTIRMIWNIQDIHLDQTIEDHLFRIIQELLSNTLRHAKASMLEVYVSENEQSVLLKVVDDGIGFDTNQEHPGNYGLRNIQERIFSMGGSVRILSFPNKGTSIEVTVPTV